MSQPRTGNPEAAAAIWPWRTEGDPTSTEPRPARARLRGVLQAAVAVVAATLLFALGAPALAAVALVAAAFVLGAALLSPLRLYAAIQRAFDALGRVTATGVTWVSMALLLYLVFLPFRLVLRRGRRDPLRRRFEPDAPTYWTQRADALTSGSRTRQY